MSRFARPVAALALAIACAAPLAVPTSAQVISSGPLQSVDPWGVGWLGRTEGALDAGLWSETDATSLVPVFAAIRDTALSPATRAIVRRVALSSGRPPGGDADTLSKLTAERIRLLFAIGEGERALDLMDRAPDAAWAKDREVRRADHELATQRTEPACARAANWPKDDPLLAGVRAACLLIAGDAAAASVTIELAASAGAADAWTLQAAEAAREPASARLEARYGSGVDLLLSAAAGLPPGANPAATFTPGMAANLADNPVAPAEVRRVAALRAAAAGLLTNEQLRAGALRPLSGEGAADPATLTALEKAVKAATAPDITPVAAANALAAALKGAGGAAEFRLAARILQPELQAIPTNSDMARNADIFARAMLVAGQPQRALAWRNLGATTDGALSPFALARLDVMLVLAGVGDTSSVEAADALIAATSGLTVPAPGKTAASKKAAATESARVASLRAETARALFILSGADRPLSAAARAELAVSATAGKSIPAGVLKRIRSAIEAGATGEALLAAVSVLDVDPGAMSFAGMSEIVALVATAGLPEEADALALEALQPWKSY